MAVSVQCPTCGCRVKGPDKIAGKVVKCPRCNNAMTVPGGAATVPSAPVPVKGAKESEFDFGRVEEGHSPPSSRRRGLKLGLIVGLGAGAVLVVVTATYLIISQIRESREDQEIAEKMKDESRSRTADESRKAREEAEAARKKTEELLGAFGDISTQAQARKCVEQALAKYVAREPQGPHAVTIGLSTGDHLFSRLLDFKTVAVSETAEAYILTVNLQIETSGGDGKIGGGPTKSRQVRYSVTKRGGYFDRAE